jgi:hypothetical protein
MEVTSYLDHITGITKYGLKCVDTRYKGIVDDRIKIPKWKRELQEAEELKQTSGAPKKGAEATNVKQPFRKLTIVKKAGEDK